MDIWELSSRMVDDLAALSPMEATYAGVTGHDDRWDDFSPDGIQEKIDYLQAAKKEVEAVDVGTDRWSRQAQLVALDFIDSELSILMNRDMFRDLNTISCPSVYIRQVFDVMDTDSPEGRADVLARLKAVPDALDGVKASLEHGRRLGMTASSRQTRGAIEQNRTHAGAQSAVDSTVAAMAEGGATETELDLAQEAADAAKAAFGSFASYLEESYLPSTEERDPVGRDRYARAIRSFLGTEIDFEDTYAWGWGEVERIWEEMSGIARDFDGGMDLDSLITLLNEDHRYAAPPNEFVQLMQERQDTALQDLDGRQFDIPPEVHRVETKLAPPGGALGAYYVNPSEDFTRPGSVWFSVGDVDHVPLWDNVSTAYHEGFPGHHLQGGVQISLAAHTSRLQRMWIWKSGSGEGWALYAERLMRELGYFDRPEYELGMLASEMLRATRVVIDIGTHVGLKIPTGQPFHPGEDWTYEIAVEMLTEYAGQRPGYAHDEVTRYVGWPGQAPAYKVGERVILGLRDQLVDSGGIDLKEFHSRVLKAGPVGLDLVRRLVIEADE